MRLGHVPKTPLILFPINRQILLANLLQSSRSTFSRGSLLNFLPSKKACWTHQFRHLGVGQQSPGIIGNAPTGAWLVARVSCFPITEMLLFIGNIFDIMERDWQKERRRVE